MPDRIEPALTAEQWSDLARVEGCRVSDFDGTFTATFTHPFDEHGRGIALSDDASLISVFHAEPVRAIIALANAALPDSDPRKITREWVNAIRNASPSLPTPRNNTEWVTTGQALATAEAHRAVLDLIADALESYLPPQTPS